MNSPVLFDNMCLKNLFDFYPTPLVINNNMSFNQEEISSATNNEFMPIINITVCKVVDNIILYPHIKNTFIGNTTQKNFIDILTYKNNYLKTIEYKDKGVSKKFRVGYGTILDENGNFLFLASFKKYLLEKSIPLLREGLVEIPFFKRDIKIFITGDFMNNHRRFYNLLLRSFLQEYIDKGCELSIMDSEMIKDSVYGNEFEDKSNFKTIEDKISFIEDFRNTILEYEQ